MTRLLCASGSPSDQAPGDLAVTLCGLDQEATPGVEEEWLGLKRVGRMVRGRLNQGLVPGVAVVVAFGPSLASDRSPSETLDARLEQLARLLARLLA